jgi:hypothetical protein
MEIFGGAPSILATRPKGEAERLPIELDISTGVFPAIPRVLGGGVLLVMALIAYRNLGAEADPGSSLALIFWLAAILFALAGLALLAIGAIGLGDQRTVRIDGERVEVSGKSLVGSEAWSEPLSAYEGVRWREFVVQRRLGINKNNRTSRLPKVYQALDLKHPDPAKCVPLYVTRFRDVTRPKWEQFAKVLGLDAIDARGGERRVRAAEDLDKSVRQLAYEGTAVAAWDQSAPPVGLELAREGRGDAERLIVTIRAKRYPVLLYGGVIAFALFFVIIGVVDLAFIPVLFGGALAAGVVWHWRSEDRNPRTITITRGAVEIHTPNPGNAAGHEALDHASIRDAQIARSYDKSAIGPHLLITTERSAIKVGAGLSQAGLGWLRDLILTAIAKT